MSTGWRVLALSLGGVLGVNARYWLAVGIDRWVGSRWPWATFTINVSGAFLIGVAATLLARRDPHSAARLLVITGFLGGYTTFSTFAFETRTLLVQGRLAASAAYALGSLAAGLVAVTIGVAVASAALPSGPPAPRLDVETERTDARNR